MKHRLEDLGILSEKLDNMLEGDFLQFCLSKHDFESWSKQFDEEFKALGITDITSEDKLFEAHVKLRFLRQKLEECYWIAKGSDD